MTAPKKPLVNWFSRVKEKSYTSTDSTYNKVKKVVAPESKISRGFTKTDSISESTKYPNDSTKTYDYRHVMDKKTLPNAKGGGGEKREADKIRHTLSGNDIGQTLTRLNSYESSKDRKPSNSRGGVSEKYTLKYGDVRTQEKKRIQSYKVVEPEETYSKTKTPKLNTKKK